MKRVISKKTIERQIRIAKYPYNSLHGNMEEKIYRVYCYECRKVYESSERVEQDDECPVCASPEHQALKQAERDAEKERTRIEKSLAE